VAPVDDSVNCLCQLLQDLACRRRLAGAQLLTALAV